MPNPFIEERLEIGFNYGASYGPRFKTAIASQSDGGEQRRSHWIDPLILVDLAERPLNKEKIDYLIDFHNSVRGSEIGFRLRDWSDYLCPGYTLGTGNGTEQTWQLTKTYTVGSHSVKRAILKPVAGSVVLRVDGEIAESGWSVNTATGVITTNLTGTLSVDEFEFDIPVRFNQDKINSTFVGADQWGKRLFQLQPLTCTEIRIQPQIYPPLDPLPDLLPQIQLGYDYGTIGGPTFDTSIVYSGSEFESRKALRSIPLGDWNIGDRGLSRAETDYLIAFFRLARGVAVPFNFYDWQDGTTKRVRFSEDVLRLRWDAYREGDRAIQFNLGGIGVKQFKPRIRLDSTTYVITLFDSSGSMDAVLAPLTAAIASLKTILKSEVYLTDEATNKYVKDPIFFSNEKYLQAVTQEYRDNTEEDKKYLFLVFMNEAATIPINASSTGDYHTIPRDLSFEPFTQYLADFADFETAYSDFVRFNCSIFVPTSDPAIDYEIAFNSHLFDAINGNNGYSPLSNYNFSGQYNFPIDATATDIYNAIFAFLTN